MDVKHINPGVNVNPVPLEEKKWFEQYKYPLVGPLADRLQDVIFMDTEIMRGILEDPAIVKRALARVPRTLRLFHRQLFTNTICYLWDSIFCVEEYRKWLNRVILKQAADQKHFDESKTKLTEDIKEAKVFTEVQERDLDEIKQEYAQLLFQHEKSSQATQNFVQELKRDVDLLNDNAQGILIELQILNLWKGWQSLQASFLYVPMKEYVALRYLPLQLLRSGQVRLPVRGIQSTVNDVKLTPVHANEDLVEPVWIHDRVEEGKDMFSDNYIARVYEFKRQAWRYTGFHAGEGEEEQFLIYPIWNFGALSLYACKQTQCVN